MSGSSLSDSCYSVSSDAAQGGPAPPARPLKLWEQVPLSADNTDILWSDGAVKQQQPQQPAVYNHNDAEQTEGIPVSGELMQIMDPCHVAQSTEIRNIQQSTKAGAESSTEDGSQKCFGYKMPVLCLERGQCINI